MRFAKGHSLSAAMDERPIGTLVSRLLLTLLTLLSLALTATAQEPIHQRELWIPEKSLPHLLATNPKAMILTRDEYLALTKDAATPMPQKLTVAPTPVVLRAAEFHGSLAGNSVVTTADFTINVLTAQPDVWQLLELPIPMASLGTVMLDGATALRLVSAPKDQTDQRATVLLRTAGTHHLQATFYLPITGTGTQQITLPRLPAAAAQFALELPPRFAITEPSIVSTTALPSGNTLHTMPMAAGNDAFTVSWRAQDLAPLAGGAVLQTCSYLYQIDSAQVNSDLGIVLRSPLARVPQDVHIPLPETARVLSVEGPDIARWSLNAATLEVHFNSAELPVTNLRILLETTPTPSATPDHAELSVTLPQPSVREANRAAGSFAITAGADVRVRSILTSGLTAQTTVGLPGDAAKQPGFVAGFSFPVLNTAPNVTFQPLEPRFQADQLLHVAIRRDAIELTRTVRLLVKEGKIFSTTLHLPAGEEIKSLALADSKEPDWQAGPEHSLTVKWATPLTSTAPTTLTLVTRLDPPGWFTLGEQPRPLSLASLGIDGPELTTGYVGLDADAQFHVSTTASTGLEPTDPAHLQACGVALAGKLTWTRAENFTLDLAVSRRPSEVHAHITTYALPLLHTCDLEGQIELDVRNSGLRSLLVAAPVGLAEHLRFDSPLIAERKLQPLTGEWTLTFHEELSGHPHLRYHWSLPFADQKSEPDPAAAQMRFSTTLPVLKLPEAGRITGTYIIEANTDTELSITPQGMDDQDILTLPAIDNYQPRHRVIAAYGWRGSAWALSLDGTRHPAAALPGLVIDALVINSILNADGTQRHELTFNLRSNGEQFFSCPLPAAAKLLSLAIDNDPVKPVADPNPAQHGLRIQLPATIEARPASIHLTYELPAATAWEASGQLTLTPPALDPNTPVLSSKWLLHLPQGFSYDDISSNLETDFVRPTGSLVGTMLKPLSDGLLGKVMASKSKRNKGNSEITADVASTQTAAISEAMAVAGTVLEPTPADAKADGKEVFNSSQIVGAVRSDKSASSRFDTTFTTKSGLIPLAVNLPSAGLMYSLSGSHAPSALQFHYVSWRRELQVAWGFILAGALLMLGLGRQRPVFVAVCLALPLHFLPQILGPEWQKAFNGALLGVLVMSGLLIVWRWFASKEQGHPAPSALRVLDGAGRPVSLMMMLLLLNSQGASTPAPYTAYVPFDSTKPLADQQPGRYFLTYDTFQKLWASARANKLAAGQPTPTLDTSAPAWAGIQSALYRGQIMADRLTLEATLSITSTGTWASVPLDFTGASITSLTLDGAAAPLTEQKLLIEKPGAHVVLAKLEMPLTSNWATLSTHLPQAAGALITLSLSDMSARITLNGGLPIVETATADGAPQRHLTAALGNATTLSLQRDLGARMANAAASLPAAARVVSTLFLSPALERLEASVDYDFPGGDRQEFSLDLDPSFTPISVDIPNVEHWSLNKGADQQTLSFRLTLPVREKLHLTLTAERPAAAKLPSTETFPTLNPSASRVEQELRVLAVDELEVQMQPATSHQQIIFPAITGAEGFQRLAAYQVSGAPVPLSLTLSRRTLNVGLRADYLYQISPSKLEIHAVFNLLPARGQDLLHTSVVLPNGFTVTRVDSDRLQDWWVEGARVQLRFSGPTPEATTLLLGLAKAWKEPPAQLELAPVALENMGQVRGRAQIATLPDVNALVTFTNQKPSQIRETSPGEKREEYPPIGDFKLTSPYESKREFTFDTPEFTAAVTLGKVAARFDTRWVMAAEVQESWVRLEARVDLEVKSGALSEFTFQLPAAAVASTEPRLTGEHIREMVRVPNADAAAPVRYKVSLQRPIITATQATLALELPHTGEIHLPDLTFPEAGQSERFVVVQNASTGELHYDAKRSQHAESLQARDVERDLHFSIAEFTQPSYFRVRADWDTVFTLEKLATTTGTKALVLYAELTTALRANGEEWLQADYKLQNRSLQFLPVRLPEGFALMSALVNEQPVRADLGERDQQAVLLIPLIQTRPGDLSLQVRLVCRKLANANASSQPLRLSLDDPELPGVTIERTVWRVALPAGYVIQEHQGNMDVMASEAATDEEDAVVVSELSSLLTLSKAESNTYELRQRSQQNAVDLAKAWNSANNGNARNKARVNELLTEVAQVTVPQTTSTKAPTDGHETWNWSEHSSYLRNRQAQRETTTREEAKLNADNLGLNDNVIVGNRALYFKYNAPAATPGKKPANANDRSKAVSKLQQADAGAANAVVDQLQQIELSRSSLKLDEGKDGAAVDLSIAMSNTAMVAANGGTVVEQNNLEFGLNYQNAANRRTMLTDNFAFTTMSAAAAPAPMPSAPAQVQTNISQPQKLRPAGRVALPISFAVDTPLAYFKKVKDHASMQIMAQKPLKDPTGRIQAALWLGVGMVLLLAGNLVRKTRRMKRGGLTSAAA